MALSGRSAVARSGSDLKADMPDQRVECSLMPKADAATAERGSRQELKIAVFGHFCRLSVVNVARPDQPALASYLGQDGLPRLAGLWDRPTCLRRCMRPLPRPSQPDLSCV